MFWGWSSGETTQTIGEIQPVQCTTCFLSTFDMVNVADLDLLEQVLGGGEPVMVAVLGDDLVTRLHGRNAVVPEAERLELVSNLRITGDVMLVTDLDQATGPDWRLVTDEESLADVADEVITAHRHSASPELLNALAHGHEAEEVLA